MTAPAVTFSDVSFAWPRQGTEPVTPLLSRFRLTVHAAQVTVVVGPKHEGDELIDLPLPVAVFIEFSEVFPRILVREHRRASVLGLLAEQRGDFIQRDDRVTILVKPREELVELTRILGESRKMFLD